MAIIVRVTVANDDSGEVEKEFAQSFDGRNDSWDLARCIKALFGRVFKLVFGLDNDDW